MPEQRQQRFFRAGFIREDQRFATDAAPRANGDPDSAFTAPV
jgi:hypothetical protein